MIKTQDLVGALSNDLFRIASLSQRGANKASRRFVQESKKWSVLLQKRGVPPYIKKIARVISNAGVDVSPETAEHYLMYGILLQNYSLRKSKS